MPTRLTLISHAPTDAQRRSSFPLDESPEDLAKVTAIQWKPPRVQQILVAPELRTQLTAGALNLTAILTPELRDLNCGIWQGRSLDALQTKDPHAILSWLTDPTAAPHHGESITSLITRVSAWLQSLITGDTGHTLAITHPAIIRAAILQALNAPPQSFWRIDVAPLTATDLRHNGRTWTLRSAATSLVMSGQAETD